MIHYKEDFDIFIPKLNALLNVLAAQINTPYKATITFFELSRWDIRGNIIITKLT